MGIQILGVSGLIIGQVTEMWEQRGSPIANAKGRLSVLLEGIANGERKSSREEHRRLLRWYR